MARNSLSYLCQQCGAESAKWAGKCEECGAWNTLVEERSEIPAGLGKRIAGKRIAFESVNSESATAPPERMISLELANLIVLPEAVWCRISHIDRWRSGIGKSTLLLQLVCKLAESGLKAAYISGEESADQVRMRAARLGLASAPVALGTATNVSDIAASMDSNERPDVLVIDSIQTMFCQRLIRHLELFRKCVPQHRN